MAKKISVQDIAEYLNRLAPPALAEEWDNVGLQVGGFQQTIHHILVALDVTEAVLWEAVEHGANLLITHHPLFLHPIKSLDDSVFATRMAGLASRMDLNILTYHTNLDSTFRGLNDLLAKQIGLTSLQPLLRSPHRRWPKAGLGRVGKISKTTLKDLLKKIRRKLSLTNLRYVGDPKHRIEKIAVMTGSGGGYFREAKAAGADVLVTGDVKYHHALEAQGEGIALVDIGHFAGEIGMVALVAEKLRRHLRNRNSRVKVFETRLQEDPFQFFPNPRTL